MTGPAPGPVAEDTVTPNDVAQLARARLASQTKSVPVAVPGAPWPRLWTPAPGVVVALASVDAVLATPAAVGRLRPEEYRSAARMAARRAREHLAGRALLRLLLAEVIGEEDARAPVVPEPAGRPRLPDSPDTGVSISHSGPFAAAAVATGLDVGVDAQVPRPPTAALLRRCCTPGTAAHLANLPPERAALAFARIWSVQEACVKARGTGLSGAPWRVRVDPASRAGTSGALHWRRPPWRDAADAERVALACAFGPPSTSTPTDRPTARPSRLP